METVLRYKQRGNKAHTLEYRFGSKQIIKHFGVVDYDQKEIVDSSKAQARIKELKSFTNREYHSFTTETYNGKNF